MCSGSCEICGKNTHRFTSSGRFKRFCSEACRAIEFRQRKFESQRFTKCSHCGLIGTGNCRSLKCKIRRGIITVPPRACIHCGIKFKPHSTYIVGYCSILCSVLDTRLKNGTSSRALATPVRWCECGKRVIPKGRPRCNECAIHRKNESKRRSIDQQSSQRRERTIANQIKRSIECGWCGRVEVVMSKVKKYCCSRCSHYHAQYRRKMRLRVNGYDDTITLAEMIKRFGSRCAVCGRQTVVTRKKYSKRKATVGHIRPVSKGGSHTWDNVQVECWACNTKIGAVTHGQRALQFA